MRRGLRGCGPAVLLLIATSASAQNQSMELVPLGGGVHAAIYSEIRMDPVEGNSLIVVLDDGVLVVDSGRTPHTARHLIAEIRKLTPKPVRWLVNTHWHDDHVFGNSAFVEAFPDVEIIAHAQTRVDLRQKSVPALTEYGLAYWTKMAEDVESRLASGKTSSGAPLSEAQRTRLQEQARTLREFLPKIPSLRVVPPAVTFTGTLTLHRGGRELQLLHLGKGNTQGDVAVYLPEEGILALGDLLVHPVPFAYGSSMHDWVATLGRFRDMDARIIVPGHGPVMRDTAYLSQVIDLLGSLVAQVDAAVGRGLTLEETRKAVDLAAFREAMAGTDPVRNGVFADSLLRSAIELAHAEAQAASSSVAENVVVDPRDGRRYGIVDAAGMRWMTRNLEFAMEGARCPRDDEGACGIDGRLYPWAEAMRACPAGWHLSTDEEWQRLERWLGMPEDELSGERLRGPGTAEPLKRGGSAGLDFPLAGWFRPDGTYREGNGNDRAAALWTSTPAGPDAAWHRDLSSARTGIWRSPVTRTYRLSVRCVADPR